MCKFESSQKDESRWQSTDSSKAYRNTIGAPSTNAQQYAHEAEHNSVLLNDDDDEPYSGEENATSDTENQATSAKQVKSSPEKIAEDLVNLDKLLDGLNQVTDPWDKQHKKILIFVSKLYFRYRTPRHVVPEIADLLVKNRFFDIVVTIWDHCHSGVSEEDSYLNSASYRLMKKICWNYSDRCTNFCKAAYDHRAVVERFMREFTIPELSVEQLRNNKKRQRIKATLSFLFNIVRLHSENKKLIRQNDGIQKLLAYYQSTFLIIKASVVLVLAHCVNEEENEKIIAGTRVIAFIVKLLASALKQRNHVGRPYRFSASELVDGLSKLAMNDNNKVLMVQEGVLPHLAGMMTGKKFPRERAVAADCLWSLSFHPDNKETIETEPGLMDSVCRLLDDPQITEDTRRSCEGILFILRDKETDRSSLSAPKTAHQKHVMISYQWDVQDTILKLRNELQNEGLQIWLDVDKMQGSILSAMAEAIENAAVVIVAMSEKYKNSNPCRTESEYAYKLAKPIVPLLMERGYKPDGWLGALLGMQLYADLSSEDAFETKINDVLRMINVKMADQNAETGEKRSLLPSSSSPSLPLAHSTVDVPPKAIVKWSKEKVTKWAEETGIDGLPALLTSFDGIALEQMIRLMRRSPDVYYSSLRSDLKLSFLQTLYLTHALEKL